MTKKSSEELSSWKRDKTYILCGIFAKNIKKSLLNSSTYSHVDISSCVFQSFIEENEIKFKSLKSKEVSTDLNVGTLNESKSIGSKMLKCEICGYRSGLSLGLSHHLKKAHPETGSRKCFRCDYSTNGGQYRLNIHETRSSMDVFGSTS